MKALYTRRMPHKTNHLPVGISTTWRKRKGRRPYLEFQVLWADRRGKAKIRHFYVGVDPTHIRLRLELARAIAFRRAYELTRPPFTRQAA
ncbi:MAG: hypothetical protein P4L11_13570 [Geothrix sp.]|nr:hypothetical protein [Geothrix sp.]